MLEKQIDKSWVLPSLTFLINEKPEMLEYYSKNLFHFSNKMINTLNQSTPICITSENQKSDLPYISLNTIGVKKHEIDYNGNAANMAPLKILLAFYENEEVFQKTLDEKIIELEKELLSLKEKINIADLKEKEKEEINKKINKLEASIYYCIEDKKNILLIENKIGFESDFYKNIFNKEIKENIPALVKQVLIYDNQMEDYISITPITSMILTKKIEEKFLKIKNNYKENNKVFSIEKADGSIGGSKPQNVSMFYKNSGFKIMAPMPIIKDQKYKKLWRFIFNGFIFKLNNSNLNNICKVIKDYEYKNTSSNKNNISLAFKKIFNENIAVAIEMNRFIEESIKEEILKNNIEIEVDFKSEHFLQKIIKQDLVKKELFSGLLSNIKEESKYYWLFNNRSDFSIDIYNDIIKVIKSKLILRNISPSKEIENIIKDSLNEELNK